MNKIITKIREKKNIFKDSYVYIALLVFNLIILFIIINLFFYFTIPIFRQVFVSGELTYSKDTLKEIYPNISPEEGRGIIEETHQGIFHVYEAFTGFKVSEFHGKYINVDKEGFRYIENQCPYPVDKSNYNIFVFGGSTTFGSGIRDKDTVPSRIQEKLREKLKNENICVYNFARPFYYSSQERELFISKISDHEEIPNMAIFIDGLNEHRLEPDNTKRMSIFMENKGKIAYLISGLPIAQVLGHFSKALTNSSDVVQPDVNVIFNRYNDNREIISSVAKKYNITTDFIIQPIPVYNYNLSNHFLVKMNMINFSDIFGLQQSRLFYVQMDKTGKKNEVIWLADMQSNKNENLYVDYGHYNTKFSDEIAEEISNKISKNIYIELKKESIIYSQKNR